MTEVLGILVLKNNLKPETIPTLTKLHQGGIPTIMITGDNISTAINVSKECGLLGDDHFAEVEIFDENKILPEQLEGGRGRRACFAIDGKSFQVLIEKRNQEPISNLLKYGKIFARMKPEHKELLIQSYIDTGKIVAM